MIIRLKSMFYQISSSRHLLPAPGKKVIISRWMDGSLHVFWRERERAITACKPGGFDKVRFPSILPLRIHGSRNRQGKPNTFLLRNYADRSCDRRNVYDIRKWFYRSF